MRERAMKISSEAFLWLSTRRRERILEGKECKVKELKLNHFRYPV